MDSDPTRRLPPWARSQTYARARVPRKESEPWSTVIFSVLKGTAIDGRATDDLKERVRQYWWFSRPAASQLLLVPPGAACWVSGMETCRSAGLDQDMWALRANQQSGSPSNCNYLNICSTFIWRRGCHHGAEPRGRLWGGRSALPLGSGAILLRPKCARPTQQNWNPQITGPASVAGGLVIPCDMGIGVFGE